MRASQRLMSVRVRFAPSPTGQLHLGGLRTLLINFLFARSSKGTLILRIEDTDQKRLVPGSVQSLLHVAHWAGLNFDEGPVQGGPHTPYVQSQRTDLYQEAAEKLVTTGHAYPCFCTPDRLFLLRKAALKEGKPPRYDNKCSHLSSSQAATMVREGKDHTIRLRLPNEVVSHSDIVFGVVKQETDEGDPIILKSDRLPTYHLANVVDDKAMGITHVIRGQEWLPSLPKHLRLYHCLQWRPPLFAHLPLMVNPGGQKLSKRNDDAFVDHYKRLGYSSIAILNYITRCGGGFRTPRDIERLYSLEDMIEEFDLSQLKRHPIVTDHDWIAKYNKQSMEAMTDEDMDKQLLTLLDERLTSDELSQEAKSPDFRRGIIKLARSRIGCIGDLLEADWSFAWRLPSSTEPLRKLHKSSECLEIASGLKNIFTQAESEWDEKKINAQLRELAERKQMKTSHIMRFIRVGLTGAKEGPPINDVLSLLGSKATIGRLNHLIALLNGDSVADR